MSESKKSFVGRRVLRQCSSSFAEAGLLYLPAAVGTLGVHQPLDRGVRHRSAPAATRRDRRERIVEDGGVVEPPVTPERIDDRLDETSAAERSWIATRGDDRGHDLRLEPDAVGPFPPCGDASPEEPDARRAVGLSPTPAATNASTASAVEPIGEKRGDGTVGSLLRCQVRDRVIDAVGVIPPFRPRDRGRYDERCDDS